MRATEHDVRGELVGYLRSLSRYWAEVEGGGSTQERLDGLLHSILVTLDGCSDGFPNPVDLRIAGEDLNSDAMLHEL